MKHQIVVATVFRNEAPYLREWLEFHLMIGVERFLLVNDRSTDDFRTVLTPYLRQHIVQVVDAPCPPRWQGRDWIAYQCALHRLFCRHFSGIARWLALIDTDEFLVPTGGATLTATLGAFAERAGVHVAWEAFGTSGVRRLAPTDLMTERLRLRQHRQSGNALGKSVVRPDRVAEANIHRCALAPGERYAEADPGTLVLHHYWTRDEHFLRTEKLPRAAQIKGWRADNALVEYFRTAYNDVPDDCMTRFLPDLRARVAAVGWLPEPAATPIPPAIVPGDRTSAGSAGRRTRAPGRRAR